MAKINFSNADVKVKVNNKPKIKDIILKMFQNEGKKLTSLQYVFCSDSYLLEINQQFLQHDTYTDIITFDLSEDTECTIGEIYISTDRVSENANQLAIPFDAEISRVIFHGALHLCGFKDKKKSEKEMMRYKEDHYLRLLNLNEK